MIVKARNTSQYLNFNLYIMTPQIKHRFYFPLNLIRDLFKL